MDILKLLQHLTHTNVIALDIARTGLEYYVTKSPLADDYCAAIRELTGTSGNLREFNYRPSDRIVEGGAKMFHLLSSSSSLTMVRIMPRTYFTLSSFDPVNNNIAELVIVHPKSPWSSLIPDLARILKYSRTLENISLHQIDSPECVSDIIAAVRESVVLKHITVTLTYNVHEYLSQSGDIERWHTLDSRVRISM